MRYSLLALALSIALHPLHAQNSDSEVFETISIQQWVDSFQGDTLSRPINAAIPMQAEIVTYTIDGLLGEELFINSEPINLRISLPRNWIKNPPSKEFSLSYNHRIMTDLRMTFSILPAQAFLGEPSADSLIAYLAGLRADYGDRLVLPESLNQELREEGYHRFLLSKPTFYLDYILLDIKSNNPQRSYSYYIPLDSTFLLELTLSGPQENVDAMLPDYKAFLRDLGINEVDE